MLEIIALIYLTRRTGALALRKGLQPGLWKFYTVLAWIIAEIIGIVIGIMLFGDRNLTGLMMLGLISAAGGYLVVRAILMNKPDSIEDDINQIGS